jgi:hypothetical protein
MKHLRVHALGVLLTVPKEPVAIGLSPAQLPHRHARLRIGPKKRVLQHMERGAQLPNQSQSQSLIIVRLESVFLLPLVLELTAVLKRVATHARNHRLPSLIIVRLESVFLLPLVLALTAVLKRVATHARNHRLPSLIIVRLESVFFLPLVLALTAVLKRVRLYVISHPLEKR